MIDTLNDRRLKLKLPDDVPLSGWWQIGLRLLGLAPQGRVAVA